MYLISEIEFLFKMMDDLSKIEEGLNPITRRMYLIGIISEMIPIITDLEIINDKLSNELSEEDARLKSLGRILEDIGIQQLKIPQLDSNDEEDEYIINFMTDLFPLNDKNYKFDKENIDSLKTGMRILCSEENISDRDIIFAYNKGVGEISRLLFEITNKKKNIKKELYEGFWYDIENRDDDLYIERAQNDYEEWKEGHDDCDIQVLRDKVTQEILRLLKTGIFKPDTIPTKRTINKSIIKISDDALEPDMTIPEDINIECARFSNYVSYKEDILFLDYTALGKYLYKHINDISDEQIDALIYFNFMLWPIHHDMAELKPKLKKFLEYEEDDVTELKEWAASALLSCKNLLEDNVGEDFLRDYIDSAFNVKELNLTHRLGGQSKFTTICHMVGMLKNIGKVFRNNLVDKDLAKVLATYFDKSPETLRRYINEKNKRGDSLLYDWTTTFVKEKLLDDKEKAFLDISKKKKSK